MEELRALRQQSGLRLAVVARAAGTSESNLSAYELGRKRLRPKTRARLEATMACGPDSPIHRFGLLTAPAAAAALRSALRAGRPTSELLRVVREFRSNGRHYSSDLDRRAAWAEPSTCGDHRWDALLAGVVESMALDAGAEPPNWVRRCSLDTLWFVGSNRGLDALALAHAEPSLLVRGVVLDRAELEAV